MIEILPVGVTCNLRCDYCYEEAGRKLTPTAKYQRDKVVAAIHRTPNAQINLFGGEPLLLGLTDLEELLKIGYERHGKTGIQTNGTLITPAHIELFRKYNTQVGISLDGPDELNDSRWAGTLEATRKATQKTMRAIEMVAEMQRNHPEYPNHGPCLIITLHRGNCAEEVFPRFKEWLRELDQKGVTFINFHWMELDYKAHKWDLPEDRVMQVMKELSALEPELKTLRFLNFNEAKGLLRGDSRTAMCVYNSCDAYSTAAVQGILPDGNPGCCTRAVKDGIDWLPGEGSGYNAPWQVGEPFPSTRSHIRQISLYNTPQEHGGCKGCRFFVTCTGHCPGGGFEFEKGREGDWRLRSTHCGILKKQFNEMEKKLLGLGETPISLSPDLPKVEKIMIASWTKNEPITMEKAIELAKDIRVDPDDPNYSMFRKFNSPAQER